MVVIKNVAIVGASGALGVPVLNALVDSKKFNVTVLTRTSSKGDFPASVKVVPVDYDSVESLTAALRGQDVVVSTVGPTGLQGQSLVIDAAVAAGVKRFLPSEFGSNTDNPKSKTLPIFGYKVAIQEYIEEKAAANPDFTYTLVRNGPFLDWGINVGFLIEWQSGKPRVYDGGDQLFSTTTLHSIGLAVVGVLTHFEETKNRGVFTEDTQVSQNQLLEIAKLVAPEKQWEPIPTDLDELKKETDAKIAKGQFTPEVLYQYLFQAIFKEGYGAVFEKNDNELLGVPGKTAEDIKAIWKALLTGGR